MSVEEIVALAQALRDQGVSRVKVGEIELEFVPGWAAKVPEEDETEPATDEDWEELLFHSAAPQGVS